MHYLPIIITAIIVALSILTIIIVRRFFSQTITFSPDDMEGLEFEEYCASILCDNGFYDIEVTKGSGDFGVDILATKDMVTYAIQCKVYSSPVGIKAVQEAYSGRDYYNRMVGAVLTNQYFTRSALDAASKLKILLWDRDYLTMLIDNAEHDSR